MSFCGAIRMPDLVRHPNEFLVEEKPLTTHIGLFPDPKGFEILFGKPEKVLYIANSRAIDQTLHDMLGNRATLELPNSLEHSHRDIARRRDARPIPFRIAHLVEQRQQLRSDGRIQIGPTLAAFTHD